MTIHRAIAGKPDISQKTRARILAEIERLGWRPNIAARGLRQGKTFTLGILVSNTEASFLPEILQGVNQEAERAVCHTFVSVHGNDFERAEHHLRTLQSKGVDGIVHYATEAGREIELLNEIHRTTPVVTIMRDAPGFQGPRILVDDFEGGRLAAEHLLARGPARVGFIGYRATPASARRQAGCESVLRERGLELRDEWSATDLVPGDDEANRAALRILSGPEPPTALFCASDRLAARAMQAAAELGLRVPADLSVVGFNGDHWGTLLRPPLTTVAQPRLEVGERAARLVLGLEEVAGPLVLTPWLVERASTGTVESLELPLFSVSA
jgi:LacI family transcriptional regulator